MSEQLVMSFGSAVAQPTVASKAEGQLVIPEISGLHYLPGFLTRTQQDDALRYISDSDWMYDLERRVQHYGWRYDYRAKNIARDMRIGPLPPWLDNIAKRLYHETELFDDVPDQAIVNEYEAGQGIAMHVDRQCFGKAIATISLGDAWIMDFRPRGGTSDETKQILLEEGSALVLVGDARDRWLHGISRRKREQCANGHWRDRRRRVSLTFRTVLL
ncbi:MAG: alpha-ketoglutarate-dependent dioxygenase AlkB [Nitrospira sp.]|nr:alpha-ketoglutarate-dependent dioxygenase AlkB [Nitrospira sp.]MCY3955313.1 alpha-ketoglutarate-dependent dioxygenase AlkB [Nitrospira sp.]MCY4131499.1 alpha-ketoglutarate-dependent dioxygenase AlkB [Nitrospira sp.]